MIKRIRPFLLLLVIAIPLTAGWSAETPVSAPAARDQRFPAVVATSTGYLAAWEERKSIDSRVVVAPLGPAGQGEPIPVLSSAMHQVEPALASAGDVVVVMWVESGGLPGFVAKAQRFTADGVPLDSEPVELGESVYVGYDFERVAAIWSGRYFLLAWSGKEGLRFVRMSREGIVLDSEPQTIPQSERVRNLPSTALYQLEPGFARTGDHLFLVFQSSWDPRCMITCPTPPPPARIEGVRLDSEGNVLDAEPIVFSQGKDAFGETYPEVASDGERFVVVWGFASAFVHGARVSVDGVVDRIFGLDTFFARVEALADTKNGVLLLTLEAPLDGGREIVMRKISSGGAVGSPQVLASGNVAPELWLSEPVREVAIATRDDGSLAVIFGRVDPEPAPILRLWYRTFEPTLRRRAAVRR